MLTIVRSKPLLCLLNVRHHWQPQTTDDGGRYERCSKCGKNRMTSVPLKVDWDHHHDKFGIW
jgi:hypothetical protein